MSEGMVTMTQRAWNELNEERLTRFVEDAKKAIAEGRLISIQMERSSRMVKKGEGPDGVAMVEVGPVVELTISYDSRQSLKVESKSANELNEELEKSEK